MGDRGEISTPCILDCMSIVHNLPDMHKPLTLIVIDSRDPDFAEDDRPVCGRCAGDEDKILIEAEPLQLLVGELRRARPHPGFVDIPVPTGFDYLLSDCANHPGECFQSLLCRWMWVVKVQLFFGCFNPCVRRPRCVTGAPISPTHARSNVNQSSSFKV